MTERVIWLNPVTTGSEDLSQSVLKSGNEDGVAIAETFRAGGFEVWRVEPYADPKNWSDYPLSIFPDELASFEASAAVISLSPFLNDYLTYGYWGAREAGARVAEITDLTCEWLDRFDGPLFTPATDPRDHFQDLYLAPRKRHHPLHDHIDRVRFLAPDDQFLDPSLRDRFHPCDYWMRLDLGERPRFLDWESHFCVYSGLKQNKGWRLKKIREWFGMTPGCRTAGEISIPGIPSLSNYERVSYQQTLDLVSQSTTSLVIGEPTHTWLQARVIQAFTQGSIASIHPENASSKWIPDEILRDQTFEHSSDFDRRLLTDEIYQRQLDFVHDLRASARPISL